MAAFSRTRMKPGYHADARKSFYALQFQKPGLSGIQLFHYFAPPNCHGRCAMTSVPVSVYLIAKNEEARIGRAIQSVAGWADEVLVVDSGSSDSTVSVAKAAGARVMHRDWDGYGPQKQFAEQQCRNDWVLNIDADEEVTPTLATEIQDAVARATSEQAAYLVRITDLLPGESDPSWFAYSYNVLRLYHRDRAQMSPHAYQDRIEVRQGRTSALAGRILHRSFISWEATVSKINFYSSQVAEERATRGRKAPSWTRIWFEFPSTFLKVWIGRRYLFRGTMGLAMALTVAYLNILRLLKTRELMSSSTLQNSDRGMTDSGRESGRNAA